MVHVYDDSSWMSGDWKQPQLGYHLVVGMGQLFMSNLRKANIICSTTIATLETPRRTPLARLKYFGRANPLANSSGQ